MSIALQRCKKSFFWKEQKSIRYQIAPDIIIINIPQLFLDVVVRHCIWTLNLWMIRHHLDLLGLAYCSAIRGVVQVSYTIPDEIADNVDFNKMFARVEECVGGYCTRQPRSVLMIKRRQRKKKKIIPGLDWSGPCHLPCHEKWLQKWGRSRPGTTNHIPVTWRSQTWSQETFKI